MASIEESNSLFSVTRSICVGIGGTGRDVLVRIRENIVDTFGSLADLPIISFVQIDTDRGGSIPNYRGQNISFTPSEIVHIKVSLNQVNQFRQNFDTRSGNEHIDTPDDNILEWFPPELIKNLQAIENGAGAVRAIGRFALFKNYQKVVESLQQAHHRVLSANVQSLIERGMDVKPGLRVFVAGSLCGGTGGGMFLDMGYILRQLFARGVADFETHGYFIICPELYGGNQHVKANTYAALKELDFYNRFGTTFEAQYPGQFRLREQREPYNYTYLISNATPGNTFIIPPSAEAKEQITNNIAQKICLSFSSNATAAAEISARDNLKAIDGGEEAYDRHPRPNRQRYMTMGLASIYFPQEQISALAANQVKIEVLEFWESGLGTAPSAAQIQRVFAGRCAWETDSVGALLKKRLETLETSGTTVQAKITQWHDNQYAAISAARSVAEQDNLRVTLPQNFAALASYVRLGDNAKERGVWLAPLVEQTSGVITDIKDSINVFLAQILQPDHEFFGLENGLSWLQHLKQTFERARGEQLQDKKRPVDPSGELNGITQRMQHEVQAIRSQRFPWWGKTGKIQVAFRTAVDQVTALAKKNYQWQISRQVQLAAEELIEFTNQKIAALDNLRNSIHNEIIELQSNADRLTQTNVKKRIGLLIISAQDTQQLVEAVLPPQSSERRLALNRISTQIIQNSTLVNSDERPSLERFLQNQFEPADVRQALNRVVDQGTTTQMKKLRKSAVQQFMATMGSRQQLLAYLTELSQQSEVLLPLNLDDGYFNKADYKQSRIIAYHQPNDDSSVEAFQQLLQESDVLRNARVVPLPDSEQHHVIFVTEYAAFPLRLINSLEHGGLKYAYESTKGRYLHTNKNIEPSLTDVLPPPPDVVITVKELFFKCLGLGIFDGRDNGDLSLLSHSKRIFLGKDWSAIIDQLSWAQVQKAQENGAGLTLTDFLGQQCSQKIQQLVENPSDWYGDSERNYVGQRQKVEALISEIRNYPREHINYSWVASVAGKDIENITGFEKKGILQELIQEIDRRIEQKIKTIEGTVTIEQEPPLLPD
jgi:hypothetical protein